MMKTSLIKPASPYCEHLIELTRILSQAKGHTSLKRISTLAFNEGKKADMLLDGKDITTRFYHKGLQWFSDNWPHNTKWPKSVPRPSKSAASKDRSLVVKKVG